MMASQGCFVDCDYLDALRMTYGIMHNMSNENKYAYIIHVIVCIIC